MSWKSELNFQTAGLSWTSYQLLCKKGSTVLLHLFLSWLLENVAQIRKVLSILSLCVTAAPRIAQLHADISPHKDILNKQNISTFSPTAPAELQTGRNAMWPRCSREVQEVLSLTR